MRFRTHQEAGFTLIEIMLVIFLMGSIVSGVIMTMNIAGADNHLKKEASRFIGFIELAEEEALLRSLEMGLVIEDDSYQFAYLDDKGRWLAFDSESFFKKTMMPEDIQLDLELEGLKSDESLFNDEPLFEDNGGLFEDTGGLFEKKKEKVVTLKPQVYIYSSGEITDFTLTMTYFDPDADNTELKVKFNRFGELVIDDGLDKE